MTEQRFESKARAEKAGLGMVPSASDVDLWQRAASYSARMHAGQLRKDRQTPYAAHPFRVAMTVCQVFGVDDAVTLAAALLHDVVEDTPADYDDVSERFGERVADIVARLTKDMRLPEPMREAEYDRALAAGCWRTKLIKLADVHDNLCDAATRADLSDPVSLVERARRAVALLSRHDREDAVLGRAAGIVEALIERHTAGDSVVR